MVVSPFLFCERTFMKAVSLSVNRVVLNPQNQTVQIDCLVVQNPDLYAWLGGYEQSELHQEVIRLLGVGVSVIRHLNTAFELDFVERRVQDLLNETQDRLQKTAQEGLLM